MGHPLWVYGACAITADRVGFLLVFVVAHFVIVVDREELAKSGEEEADLAAVSKESEGEISETEQPPFAFSRLSCFCCCVFTSCVKPVYSGTISAMS